MFTALPAFSLGRMPLSFKIIINLIHQSACQACLFYVKCSPILLLRMLTYNMILWALSCCLHHQFLKQAPAFGFQRNVMTCQ